ncbi:hypothetical protein MPSEU_000115700 [Mayamaea pseudoterrestris]|nr:hypothetical protein MPSEU_000115700 [Mayamaea pseudoterrestris]
MVQELSKKVDTCVTLLLDATACGRILHLEHCVSAYDEGNTDLSLRTRCQMKHELCHVRIFSASNNKWTYATKAPTLTSAFKAVFNKGPTDDDITWCQALKGLYKHVGQKLDPQLVSNQEIDRFAEAAIFSPKATQNYALLIDGKNANVKNKDLDEMKKLLKKLPEFQGLRENNIDILSCVSLSREVTKRDIFEAFLRLGQETGTDGAAFVYYSGNGNHNGDENYLCPNKDESIDRDDLYDMLLAMPQESDLMLLLDAPKCGGLINLGHCKTAFCDQNGFLKWLNNLIVYIDTVTLCQNSLATCVKSSTLIVGAIGSLATAVTLLVMIGN